MTEPHHQSTDREARSALIVPVIHQWSKYGLVLDLDERAMADAILSALEHAGVVKP